MLNPPRNKQKLGLYFCHDRNMLNEKKKRMRGEGGGYERRGEGERRVYYTTNRFFGFGLGCFFHSHDHITHFNTLLHCNPTHTPSPSRAEQSRAGDSIHNLFYSNPNPVLSYVIAIVRYFCISALVE